MIMPRNVSRSGVHAIVAFVAFASASIVLAASPRQTEVPVEMGGHAELDVCGTWAEVSGLNPEGDGFLAVRAGPGKQYAIRGRLREGDTFYVCDNSRDGKWFGIVYPRKGQVASDCGVSGQLAQIVVYGGPCGHGWVHVDWVRILAG